MRTYSCVERSISKHTYIGINKFNEDSVNSSNRHYLEMTHMTRTFACDDDGADVMIQISVSTRASSSYVELVYLFKRRSVLSTSTFVFLGEVLTTHKLSRSSGTQTGQRIPSNPGKVRQERSKP